MRQRVGSGRGGEAERGGDTERQREPRRHPCRSACTVLGLLAVDLNLLPSLQHLPQPPASPSLTPRTIPAQLLPILLLQEALPAPTVP